MSATQLHLALNHLPLFGTAIAIVPGRAWK